jgi:hypothetical protein
MPQVFVDAFVIVKRERTVLICWNGILSRAILFLDLQRSSSQVTMTLTSRMQMAMRSPGGDRPDSEV